MNKLMIAVCLAAMTGCVCTNCRDVEARLAAIEKTPAVARQISGKRLSAPKKAERAAPAQAPKPVGLSQTQALAASRKVGAPPPPSADPALRTAAQVRYDAPKLVEQWENDHGTVTRVVLKSGVLSTNEVPKIVIEGTVGPTKYSKKAIGDALAHMGYWTQVKAMLQTIEVENGRTAWDVWSDAAWFLEDDPVFLGALEQAKQALGVTQEQLDAMLRNCIY